SYRVVQKLRYVAPRVGKRSASRGVVTTPCADGGASAMISAATGWLPRAPVWISNPPPPRPLPHASVRPAGHRGGALLGQPGLRLRASAHVHLRYMVVALGASHRRRRSPGPCPDRATCRRYLTAA